MKEPDWIDAKSACVILGIKPQTLYAYVSRRQIRARADPNDARLSLYSRRDVDTLLRQKRRPRARADVAEAAIRWGDPVLPTSISEIRDGTIWVRGHAIEDCAETLALEEVAELLCGGGRVTSVLTKLSVEGSTPFARAMKALAQQAEAATPMQGRSAGQMAREVGNMISLIADACLGRSETGHIHTRIGSVWGLDGTGTDAARRALVLLSDHELNPSTFAVRVCAATGASLPASLLAGMATLSGPLHGGVAGLTNKALGAAIKGRFDTFLNGHAESAPYAFGFGHPLYPEGDPRARHLLEQIPRRSAARMAVGQISDRLAIAPNIDAALAALEVHFAYPPHAATSLFAIGRAAGWIAHAIEQVQSGQMIRPRARYLAEP
ncbi:citrate synthase family protein [Thalassococcus sp. S3]|uniref:citrate synthase family protein n=1 Tax=Thalassococcus sp. S3 TaxID=2017482 RepID=UPI00102B7ABC|nr:citrate synthase family protein [Thalassococcus sp. S3]